MFGLVNSANASGWGSADWTADISGSLFIVVDLSSGSHDSRIHVGVGTHVPEKKEK